MSIYLHQRLIQDFNCWQKNCISNMHLMFFKEKTLRKWTFSSHSDQKSKSNSLGHISYYQWVQANDSEANRFQKMEKKILVYQVLYISDRTHQYCWFIGVTIYSNYILYTLYFFRLNKESCTICDTCVHIYHQCTCRWFGLLYLAMYIEQILDFAWSMMGNVFIKRSW